MSVLIPFESSYYFSSDPAFGAQNVSADGSRFSVALNTPIQLPRAAMNATIEVTQASVWNTSPNISATIGNNAFTFTTSNAANAGTHSLVIPDGLYSLAGLNGYIGTALGNLGLPTNLITLSGDDATQKTVLTFLDAGDSVDFTVANSVREVLGFNSRIAPAAPQAAGWNEFSDNVAAFNRVNSFILTSDLVSNGIPTNSTAAKILANVPITSSAGNQVNFQPQTPTRVSIRELIGGSRTNFSFQILDQLLRPLDTNSEFYTMLLTLRWHTLLTSEKVPMMSV